MCSCIWRRMYRHSHTTRATLCSVILTKTFFSELRKWPLSSSLSPKAILSCPLVGRTAGIWEVFLSSGLSEPCRTAPFPLKVSATSSLRLRRDITVDKGDCSLQCPCHIKHCGLLLMLQTLGTFSFCCYSIAQQGAGQFVSFFMSPLLPEDPPCWFRGLSWLGQMQD